LNNDKENLNNNNFEEIFQKIFIDYSDENFYDFSQKIFVNNSNEKILFSLTCLISINTSLFLIYLCIVALNFKIRTIYEYDSEIDNNKENSFDLFQKFYSAFFTKLLFPLEKDKVLKISFTNNLWVFNMI
jgi:ABC-type anion transport system duplicated permease subunit